MILHTILSALYAAPERPAVISPDAVYTYGMLARQICALQPLLAPYRGQRALLYDRKSPRMLANMLACAFAGVTYIPADASYPAARVEKMAELAAPALVFTDLPLKLPGVRRVEPQQTDALPVPTAPLTVQAKETDTAYILFTSGSTGTPKGVKVSWRNLTGFGQWLRMLVGFAPARVLNQAAFSFDLSVADILLALTSGGALVLTPPVLQGFPALFSFLHTCQAEAAVMTPSFAEMLLSDKSFDSSLLPELRLIFFCGEPLRPSTVLRLRQRFEDLRIINAYGPTEATVAVTAQELAEPIDPHAPLSAGTPLPGTQVVIADAALHPLPPEQEGEILLVGDAVAQGYVGGIGGGFCTYEGQKAYRTGDLGRLRGGELFVSGRTDDQLKFKGYRVEPGEIEAQLCALPGVAEAVVVPRRSADGTVQRLVAFVRPEPGFDSAQVHQALARRLPDYMCPVLRPVQALARNQNGKYDRKALEAMLRE